MTQSDLEFAATRYENGQTLMCEAENSVLREQKERPMRQRLTLEVLCKFENHLLINAIFLQNLA